MKYSPVVTEVSPERVWKLELELRLIKNLILSPEELEKIESEISNLIDQVELKNSEVILTHYSAGTAERINYEK